MKSGAGESGTEMLLTEIALGGDRLGEEMDLVERLADITGKRGGECHTTGSKG